MELDEEIPTHLFVDYVALCFLPLVILFGLILNIFALRRITKKLKSIGRNTILKKAYLWLIIQLSLNDLFLLCTYALGRFFWLVTYEWKGGDFLCKFYHFLTMMSLHQTSLLIATVAVYRRMCVDVTVNCAFYRKSVQNTVILLISVTWFASALFSLGQWYVWLNYEPYGNGFVQCTTIWEKFRHVENYTEAYIEERIYIIVHLAVAFWIPFFVVCTCYTMVVCRLVKKKLSRRHLYIQFAGNGNHASANNCKTYKILAFIVTSYMVCWLPSNILMLWAAINPSQQERLEFDLYILHSLVLVNCIVNPLIYGFQK